MDGAYFRRGLSTEGNLRFKIDWASLIVGSKFTIFALFYFVFEGNFPSTSPRGAYIWRGDLTECLRYRFGGLIFGGAYTWRGFFSEFYGTLNVNFVCHDDQGNDDHHDHTMTSYVILAKIASETKIETMRMYA